MSTYLLQVQTSDLTLMLRTEISATNLNTLQNESRGMVKSNPQVKGLSYRIFIYTKNKAGSFDSRMIKEDTISH